MQRGDIKIIGKTFHAHKYMKSIIYGGLDGIITTFAIVSGVTGAALSANIILIMGFANLIADGVSMAAGDYLSTKAKREYDNKKGKSVALKNASVTFISFVIFGFIPLSAYVIDLFFPIKNSFLVSLVLTGIALFSLGILKFKITTNNWLRSGLEMLFIGGLAALIAYLIGAFIASLV